MRFVLSQKERLHIRLANINSFYKEDNKYYCWPRTFSFELEFPLRHFYCRYESARLHSSLFLMEIQVKLKKPTQKSEMQISFLTLRSTPLAKVFPFFYSTFH